MSTFRELLGFTERLPFECIGQAEEVRLAFELCLAKGLTGAAFDMYARERRPFNLNTVLNKYLAVYDGESSVPERLASPLREHLGAHARKADTFIRELLAESR